MSNEELATLGRKLYPESTSKDWDGMDSWDAPCDYSPIIRMCGEIVMRADDGDYQGDTFAIVKDGDRVGFLAISWGSCSGCDALQACYSPEDAGKLAKEIVDSVHWETSPTALLAWLDGAEERNEIYAHAWEDEEERKCTTFGVMRENYRKEKAA